ncbi:unnamed protein product [Rotaria magnacalcarata]|uniref:Uncharacterized protein n=2 Tax=Rotaria magnacalcarata TaxID=392030 RepID=A0A817ALI5_9BILA|nr:unnamed protein product [Rotaria magnacalcarata]
MHFASVLLTLLTMVVIGGAVGKISLPTVKQITSSSTGYLYQAFKLNAAFQVTKNTLFKVTFQGSFYNWRQSRLDQYVQIMVNDYLSFYNRLIPNTNQRVTLLSGVSNRQTDAMGGYYYDATNADTMVPLTRVAMVYLPPGIYSFNVGVRSVFGSGRLIDGTVTYELIQIDNNDNKEDLGDFKLTKLPL